VLEDKIARKMADMFADSRINVFVLAAMTRRHLSPRMVQVIEEWWDLHKADASTYIDNGQIRLPFDIDTYKVDY
jgi:hypothetical protein